MKENILDVLMYLFENYINDDIELDANEESLRNELLQAGFKQHEISKAFDWLEGLASLQETKHQNAVNTSSLRVYTPKECEKLAQESRGFLMFLENVGVLDHATREMVVDRVMALDSKQVELDDLKWVVLMVLFNLPGREAAYAWIEDPVFEEATNSLH